MLMGQVSRCLRRATDGYAFWCPGCLEMHHVWVDRPTRPCWTFNGNLESPTFTPSLLITGKQIQQDAEGRWIGGWITGPDGVALDSVCHSFVTDGRIIFLGDCTHALKGQTVPIPDLPAWAVDSTREEAPMSDLNENAATPPADLTEATSAPQEAVSAQPADGDAAQSQEAAPTPLEMAVAGNSEAAQAAEPANEPEKAQTETLTLAVDAGALAAVVEALTAQISDGFDAIKREFGEKMGELAEHCESRIESLAQALEAADVTKVQSLVEEARQAVSAIQQSGVAGVAERLTLLELKLRHTL